MSDKPGTSAPPPNPLKKPESKPAGSGAPPAKTTELELAFAKDPSSEAIFPLCEAYISQGRFMEAMVLGRKALKAKPEDKPRRLLLARVLAEQGKVPKALEEVQAILAADAQHIPSKVMLGKLLEKSGKKQEAIAEYKAVIDLEEGNQEAKAALAALGVNYSKAPPPPPPPPPRATASAMPAARQSLAPRPAASRPPTPAAGAHPSIPPSAMEVSTPPTSADADPAAGSMPPVSAPPRPRPRARRALTEADLGITTKPEPAKGGLKKTLVVGVGGLVVVAMLIAYMSYTKMKIEKLAGLATQANEALATDGLLNMRKAILLFEEMNKVSSNEPKAVANIAYIKAIMYAQYGLGTDKDADRAVQNAENHADKMAATQVARSMLLMKEGKVDEAFNLIKDTIEKLGDNAAVEVALGDAYLAKGKIEDANNAYTSARNRGPKEVRPLYASGEFFRLIGRERESIGNLDAALRMDRDHAPARVSRALLRLESGTSMDVAAAQTDLNSLNERQEAMGTTYAALARVVFAELQRINGTGDPRKDLEDLRRPLGANHPELVLAFARLEMDKGKYGEAVKLFKDVATRFPYRLGAHFGLVRALIGAGQYAQAETAIEEAQKTLPKKNLDLAILVSVARREKRDFKGAHDALEKASEIARDHPRIQLEQARTFTEEKKYDEALTILPKAVERASDERPAFMAELLTQIAITLQAKGVNPTLALESLDGAHKADPNYGPAYYWRGMVLKANPKAKDDARAAFSKYIEKAPRGDLIKQAQKERDAL